MSDCPAFATVTQQQRTVSNPVKVLYAIRKTRVWRRSVTLSRRVSRSDQCIWVAREIGSFPTPDDR
jgi:hypothetical protein